MMTELKVGTSEHYSALEHYTALLCGGFIEFVECSFFLVTNFLYKPITCSTLARDKADVSKKGIFCCLAKFRARSLVTVRDERSDHLSNSIRMNSFTVGESWLATTATTGTHWPLVLPCLTSVGRVFFLSSIEKMSVQIEQLT